MLKATYKANTCVVAICSFHDYGIKQISSSIFFNLIKLAKRWTQDSLLPYTTEFVTTVWQVLSLSVCKQERLWSLGHAACIEQESQKRQWDKRTCFRRAISQECTAAIRVPCPSCWNTVSHPVPDHSPRPEPVSSPTGEEYRKYKDEFKTKVNIQWYTFRIISVWSVIWYLQHSSVRRGAFTLGGQFSVPVKGRRVLLAKRLSASVFMKWLKSWRKGPVVAL